MVRPAGPAPYTLWKPPLRMNVGTSAEAADSLLLSATTYSFWCLRSIRENAKIPGPSEA